MIKHILIALVLFYLVCGVGNAAQEHYCWADGDHEGVYTRSWGSGINQVFYTGSCENLYIKWYIDVSGNGGWRTFRYDTNTACFIGSSTTIATGNGHGEGIFHATGCSIGGISGYNLDAGALTMTVIVSNTSLTEYTVSGSTDCVDEVELHIKNVADGYFYELESNTSIDNYSFDVLDGHTYRLFWKPGAAYTTFIVNGSNEVIDFDDCTHTQYRFEESCGNLIPDSEGFYSEIFGGFYGTSTYFSVPSGILDISNSSADGFDVFANSFIGQRRWRIEPVVADTTYTLENPDISWNLKVIVQNESDDALIDGAMVKVDQSCYCTSGFSTRQKLTVNGMVNFGEMSLQDASLFVMKTGYKILDENTTGYSAFLSGRSNFSSKTWIVKLANSSSNNSSSFYEVANKVDIYFRDVNGDITSKILDTDAHVDLYYQNNNTEEEAMTLRFESSSTHTYFMPERTYNIPHDESGYKRITNGYFTPWDYSYRAVIYNSSIYGWNITIPLTVRNGTRETEQHYQNLTTNLCFMYANDGKVDYRDDLKVAIHAQSNNTTLLVVDVELWIDGVYSGCKNLTATDLTGAEVPYYYVWEPAYSYVSGSNYSIRMYGFDRTLLETDYVVCITDNTTRKNKLTIIVKNHYGTNLDNGFVFLEGYGSLPTGTNYYNSYEGLDNGYYRFKATKSGYTGTGWNDITLSDSDEIVTYVLTASASAEGGATQPQKMDDTTLRNLYIPLMALLLILILFGGLKSVL